MDENLGNLIGQCLTFAILIHVQQKKCRYRRGNILRSAQFSAGDSTPKYLTCLIPWSILPGGNSAPEDEDFP